MKAIIMAGGEGSRLRPLTCDRPKPMVPIANRPVMEHAIQLLKTHGIDEIGVTLQYLPEHIIRHFGDGSSFGVKLRYFIEEIPLGTAGSVKNAEEFLDDTFLVVSGDALTDLDLTRAVNYHRSAGAVGTLVLTTVDSPLEFGVVITAEDGRIRRFLEKPGWGEVFSDEVNTGIYVLEPEVLTYFNKGQKFDFSKDLFPLLMEKGRPLYGCVLQGYWCDIGNQEQYQEAQYSLLDGRVVAGIPGELWGPGVWIGKGTEIHPDAEITGPVLIGKDCRISQGAKIDSHTVIGNNVIIEEQASIKRSIIWDNVYIGKKAAVRGAVICNRVILQENTTVFEGAAVGDRCLVKRQSIIKPEVKIWPQKTVEQGTAVNTSLVWGNRCAKNLFGREGIPGLVNQDITPEFACRLGAAYGSILEMGSQVALSSDGLTSAKMIKAALGSGLASAGVELLDLGTLTSSILRHAVRSLELKGGIHLKTDSEDRKKIWLQLMDSQGMNLTRDGERKIENTFWREEYRRADVDRLGKVTPGPQCLESYQDNLVKSVDAEAIRAAGFRLVWTMPAPGLKPVMNPLFESLGCDILVEESQADGWWPFKDLRSLVPGLGETVRENGANLGFVVDNNGEVLLLVDDKGNAIDDLLFPALMSLIIFRANPGGTVAVPVNTSHVIDTIASRYQGKVIRTKTALRSLMEKALSPDIQSLQGQYQQFGMQFDAVETLVKLLGFLAAENIKLSELIAEIPDIYLSRKTAYCPWEEKGRVMRTLINDRHQGEVELLDGIKIYHPEGWALVLPDSVEPVYQVYSEGFNQEIAQSLTDMYVNRINEILNTKAEQKLPMAPTMN
ncbi:MAG: sugar phosphate nucleotidyltransferase [Bacillota bacterium]